MFSFTLRAGIESPCPETGGGCRDIDRLIRMTDRQRADYIRMYFGCNWNDPHLYHMLISSEFGEDCVTRMIVDAIKRGDDHAPESSGVRQS